MIGSSARHVFAGWNVPADIALGFIGGVLCGADKLSRVAWLQSDPAVAEVLEIEADGGGQGEVPPVGSGPVVTTH